jgi:hypothetical protein
VSVIAILVMILTLAMEEAAKHSNLYSVLVIEYAKYLQVAVIELETAALFEMAMAKNRKLDLLDTHICSVELQNIY